MSIIAIVTRLVLSVILGGLIGMERENKNRPAGFRTHILVCVGAALVMITSEFISEKYRGITAVDPTRLGAQVISGIGFLGAGTIIRQGASVKGLTTAASLWAVACVGLAAGCGFYWGALGGAVIIYITLILLSKFEILFERKSAYLNICVEMKNKPGKIGEIGMMLGRYDVSIRNIEFLNDGAEEEDVLLKLSLKLPHGLAHDRIIKEIAKIEGINSIERT